MPKKQNKPLLVAGTVIVVIAFLKFLQNLQGAPLQSGFSLGELWAAQPQVMQSVLLWAVIAIVGVIVIFKSGEKRGI